MRSITKRVEPTSLAHHRQTLHSTFDNFPDKDHLRQVLVSEQRQLCCYCMGRIRPESESMKIEHWLCQAYYCREQLSYKNLLGACRGGEGQPSNKQHCDTRKGNQALRWNPAEPTHRIESRIAYAPDGSILGDEGVFDSQLNNVLNLNLPLLKQARKGIYDAVLEWWKHEKARLSGRVPRERLIRRRDQYVAGNGQLKPYCQVAVWLLDQRIARMNR